MKALKVLFTIIIISFLTACSQKKSALLIKVQNTLDIERTSETVELSKSFLKVENLASYGVKNVKTNKVLISQLIDNNDDGIIDVLLFQVNIAANSTNTYQVIKLSKEEQIKHQTICYSRFVPERTDDYAWENDKVAFRVFGPNAQYRFENKLKEGTLSSGVDAWLKRVDYSIINGWYDKYTNKTGSYHEDTGEGLDNFHVGSSRGVGGLAYKQDSTYYISKNFTKWKTITTGPIRTSFYLEYDLWGPEGKQIKESRIISLDKGSNLSKFEVNIEGVKTISAGLTLHEKDGLLSTHKDENWINYWQPHLGKTQIGTAIIAPSLHYAGNEKYDVKTKDLSNAYVHLNVKNNKVIYYSGFTWSKSNQFKDKYQWERYLSAFSKKINTPLNINIIKQ
ncbi:DUF4861 domain-containing protein [Postechiella marina]|uniref:DUF4861 domain-containing protein n=1 Tax=Postechiella marina TaxID=943941 RepID=A0ABP8C326_9FLAO